MPLPSPSPLAARPTIALGCTGLHFPTETLRAAHDEGIAPVLMHRLTGEDGSSDDGPREMLEQTVKRLADDGHTTAWGAACKVQTAAEAAAFATAGYTWFSFNLAGKIDPRGDTMSLDELDSAIVAIEDAGLLTPDWHTHYTDRDWKLASGKIMRLNDETLARAAVKYAPALAHAAQLQQAIRTLWTGRGAAPDIELNFAGLRESWSAEEFLFLALESAQCGLAPVSIAPSLGAAWQPGAEFTGDNDLLSANLNLAGEIAALAGPLKVGIHHTAGKSGIRAMAQSALGTRAHLDCEEDAWLATLDAVAREQPDVFRRWLSAAQDAYPFAASEVPLAITEEDIHVLPQVDDADLPATFLADIRGRQLLLATFVHVLRSDRSLRDAISGAR